MNPSEVRKLALLSAAKVAFSAALVGCGGVVVVSGEGPGEGGGSTTGADPTPTPVPWGTPATAGSSSSSASTMASSTTASSATGGVEGECGATTTAPFAPEAVACCQALLTSTFAAGPAGPPPPATPNLVGCCDMALVVRDTQTPGAPPPETFAWETTYACCQVPGVTTTKPFSPTCTPWGPPVPPALPEGLGWLEEAA